MIFVRQRIQNSRIPDLPHKEYQACVYVDLHQDYYYLCGIKKG